MTIYVGGKGIILSGYLVPTSAEGLSTNVQETVQEWSLFVEQKISHLADDTGWTF